MCSCAFFRRRNGAFRLRGMRAPVLWGMEKGKNASPRRKGSGEAHRGDYLVSMFRMAAGKPGAVTATSMGPASRQERTAISALPSKVTRLPVP